MAAASNWTANRWKLLNKALQLDPQNATGPGAAARAAFEAHKYDQAVEYWQKVLPTLPANSEVKDPSPERISEARRLAKTASSK